MGYALQISCKKCPSSTDRNFGINYDKSKSKYYAHPYICTIDLQNKNFLS